MGDFNIDVNDDNFKILKENFNIDVDKISKEPTCPEYNIIIDYIISMGFKVSDTNILYNNKYNLSFGNNLKEISDHYGITKKIKVIN